ncbi:MAG: methyltransferase domain-containing protein [Verrucomicrobiae bacterium]|nr:methyltransferase domain-containing protein [Verrucomicrobiae bacterium]
MSHQDTYLRNEAYAEYLAGWDPAFYSKYAAALRPDRPGGRVLDVGCGVGQVVRTLKEEGYDACGVDVSEPCIRRARLAGLNCSIYDGRRLPYPDTYFDSVGAFNVLEHVEEPEAFLVELVRVTKPRGRVVVSSPNFFRALGWRDYHPHMRGLRNKWRNLMRLLAKHKQIRSAPGDVKFDRLQPIVKEPFSPDDDAIVATNGLEIAFFLEKAGCAIERVDCTDRKVNPVLDFILNLTPLRYLMFNAFVVAHRKA